MRVALASAVLALVCEPAMAGCVAPGPALATDNELAMAWSLAQRLANLQDTGRPAVCFETTRAETADGKRILAVFDRQERLIHIHLGPQEFSEGGRCVLEHEFLHALLGGNEAERKIRDLSPCPSIHQHEALR